MPARLRSQVSAVHETTVTLTRDTADAPVEPDVLMTLARACRDHEHVSAGYIDRAGTATNRRLEPYQLVTTGPRWYLLAYDRDRDDWRSLRLDRMSDVRALGTTFHPRPAPDAADYVRRSISVSPYRYVARVRYRAPQDSVAQHFSPTSVTIEAEGPDTCVVTVGADDPQRMVLYLALPGYPFQVLEPPEVVRALATVAERLRRAGPPQGISG
jgi:predicted DNA-binding transcriptional regulator YafY